MAQPSFAQANESDWPRAMELVRAGQTEAALPLLERLVSAHPRDKNYRFELALALFNLGRDFRAKWHLEQVRGAKLTPPEAQFVDHYLAAIVSRSVWSTSFSIALKPESNASRKTSIDTVNIGGLNFTLTPNSLAKPGVSVVVATALGYSPHLTNNLKANFSLAANLKQNKDRDLRDYRLSARSGLEYLLSDRSNISAGLEQGYRWVGQRPYSQSSGVWAEYSRLVGTRGRLDVGAEVGNTRYLVALPDSQRRAAKFGYSYALSNNARLTFAGFWDQTQGAKAHLVGTRTATSVTMLYAWDGGLMTSFRLGKLYDKRRGPEPLFEVTRKDRNMSMDLTIYHRNLRVGAFAPTIVIGLEKNRSNIPLADYDNRYISIGLTQNF